MHHRNTHEPLHMFKGPDTFLSKLLLLSNQFLLPAAQLKNVLNRAPLNCIFPEKPLWSMLEGFSHRLFKNY